jgi:hypothetical protein
MCLHSTSSDHSERCISGSRWIHPVNFWDARWTILGISQRNPAHRNSIPRYAPDQIITTVTAHHLGPWFLLIFHQANAIVNATITPRYNLRTINRLYLDELWGFMAHFLLITF